MTIATNGATKPSMNEANERDPFNNNSYGTLVDQAYKLVSLPVLDVVDFNERIIRGYEEGYGERDLPADLTLARSLIPAGTVFRVPAGSTPLDHTSVLKTIQTRWGSPR